MNQVIIKKATAIDVNEIVIMRKKLLIESLTMGSGYNWNDFESACSLYYTKGIENNIFFAYIASLDGINIGYVAMSYYFICPTLKDLDGNMAMLTDLYINPKYRKQDIGFSLMELAMNQARNDGYRKISLNSSAIGRYVYEKYGFTDVMNEMTYKFY